MNRTCNRSSRKRVRPSRSECIDRVSGLTRAVGVASEPIVKDHRMTDVLNGLSNSAVTAAIEQNNIDLFIFATELGGKTILREEDYTGVIGKPWWPNYLFQPRFSETTIEDRIQRIREGIEQRKLPPLLKFGPKARPVNLRERLLRNGFLAMDHNPPGMAMGLDAVDGKCSFPGNLRIERVVDEVGLREWLSFFTLFEFDMFKVLIESPRVRLYVGRIDGEPVGTSMLFLSSGVAGIYQVEVSPEHRRKGIGTDLTLAPMRDAREMGYRIAVLQASKMGEPVYKKIGFESYFNYNYCHPKGSTFADFMAA